MSETGRTRSPLMRCWQRFTWHGEDRICVLEVQHGEGLHAGPPPGSQAHQDALAMDARLSAPARTQS